MSYLWKQHLSFQAAAPRVPLGSPLCLAHLFLPFPSILSLLPWHPELFFCFCLCDNYFLLICDFLPSERQLLLFYLTWKSHYHLEFSFDRFCFSRNLSVSPHFQVFWHKFVFPFIYVFSACLKYLNLLSFCSCL